MSNAELLGLIAVIASIVVAFAASMFLVFRWFLERERQRGENFRVVNRKD